MPARLPSPSGRHRREPALVVVPQGDPGSDLVVQWVAFDRGYGSLYEASPQDLFVVHFEGTLLPTAPMPVVHCDIAPLPLDREPSPRYRPTII